MAEIRSKSCVINAFLHACIVSVILSTADSNIHVTESNNNLEIKNQLGCETLYIDDTVITLDMSKFNGSCLRIMALPGMGIRMDFQDVNSTWSIYDYFYIQLDQNCEDNGILALTDKPQSCSTIINTSALVIHFHASLIVHFTSSSINRRSPYQVCNVLASSHQSYDHNSQPCSNLTYFEKVHIFTPEVISYSELIRQHPSLNFTTFPDIFGFEPKELPPLNLATIGKGLLFYCCACDQSFVNDRRPESWYKPKPCSDFNKT